MSVSNKGIAVVTGASAGIGKVYADRLASRGYDLLLVARRGELLETVAAGLRSSHGVNVDTMVADLTDPAALAKLASAIASNEAVTMLVNNAGTATLAGVFNVDTVATDAMTDINITALVALTAAVLPGFKTRNAGTIINLSSVLGLHWLPVSAIYGATKAYVMYYTRALQEELAGTGVVIQLVMPAATATDLWDISGVPLSALDSTTVMTAEHMVDASLAGLDAGETVTMPSVEDLEPLLAAYDSARVALLMSAQRGVPAKRYGLAA